VCLDGVWVKRESPFYLLFFILAFSLVALFLPYFFPLAFSCFSFFSFPPPPSPSPLAIAGAFVRFLDDLIHLCSTLTSQFCA